MRKLCVFLFGMIVGGGIVAFGFKYHVVYTNEGLVLVPKKQAAFADLYVDVRAWKPPDWQAHPALVHSLISHGRGDLIGNAANEFLREMGRKLGHAERVDDELRLQ